MFTTNQEEPTTMHHTMHTPPRTRTYTTYGIIGVSFGALLCAALSVAGQVFGL